MNPNQAFEQAILLAMAFLALSVVVLLVSIALGRRKQRREFAERFPRVANPTRVPSRHSIETNFGRF